MVWKETVMKRICKACGKETDMPFHTCDRSSSTVPVPEFARKPLEALRKIAMEKNNPIRTNNLYISSQLHRWLKWMAELETGLEQDRAFKATPDSTAEGIMRAFILSNYPTIQQLEADYWTARNRLDTETVNKLKEQTAQTKPL